MCAIDFWHRGLPTPPIVVSQDAVVPVRQAAEALQNALQEATGEKWQIVSEAPEDGLAFYLGSASGKDAAFTDALPHDGFWTQVDASGVRIAGRDYAGGPRTIFMHPMRDVEAWNDDLKLCAFGDMGTWNGVHHFLETLGFRWYMPGKEGTVIPKLDAIQITETETVTSPAFEYRTHGSATLKQSLRTLYGIVKLVSALQHLSTSFTPTGAWKII